ncbi:MAG: class I SAM-dependent methyltransferase [Variovorax sp.]|nr:class I SAM-dependent methyltransferase [Variovorax sp.]
MVDTAAKFFSSIRIHGWFHHPEDKLIAVHVHDAHLRDLIAEVGLPSPGVAGLGMDKCFAVQLLRDTQTFGEQIRIEFETAKGWRHTVPLLDLCHDRIARYPTLDMARRFRELVIARPGARLLDIGGRARSRFERRTVYPGVEYTVLDIVEAPEVDVVGDAHRMSQLFPSERFDFVLSVSVFEHLMMPWTIAIEMNQVMKPGALAYIHTHQTIGLHDAPWDFWRFSEYAWDALFNARTGFEIVERGQDFEQYIVPFVFRENKEDAERSAGFESSAVLVRKIGDPTLAWNVTPADLTATSYPEHDDGQSGRNVF